MDRMLSVAEAAEQVGVSESFIYQACQERLLVLYRLGGIGKRGRNRNGIRVSNVRAITEEN